MICFLRSKKGLHKIMFFSRSNDVTFITSLKAALLLETINLLDVPSDSGDTADSDLENTLFVALIVVTALLTSTLVGIVVYYWLKIRALNRQLRAMSTPYEIADPTKKTLGAPTSNEFAKAGLNPVLHMGDKNHNFDTIRFEVLVVFNLVVFNDFFFSTVPIRK